MTARIDDFKAAFSSGFAQANRYKVFFPTAGLIGRGRSNSYTLSIMCDKASLPGRQLSTEERFTNMKAQKMPYAFAHEDLSISFLIDNDWTAWDYLNTWQSRIIYNISGLNSYTVNYQNEYARDIEVHHLDTQNYPTKRILFKSAFPTTLNAVELGNSNGNEVIRVDAEFSYHNWENV